MTVISRLPISILPLIVLRMGTPYGKIVIRDRFWSSRVSKLRDIRGL